MPRMNETAPSASTGSGAAAALRDFLAAHQRLFVLTGAGVSIASGIPEYRDADGEWKRPQPVQFRDFLRDPHCRRRYWARSLAGWPWFQRARPGAAHRTLARWQDQGRVARLVTQNVDRLHQQAGSREVIDLHGRLDRVVCLDCAAMIARSALQDELLRRNPAFAELAGVVAPDGDADLGETDYDGFEVPACPGCGGVLKPDVVFFGESVPGERVSAAAAALHEADAMLVVGSSLMVYSGFRFCRMAHAAGIPIAAVNPGRTRADDLLALKITARFEDLAD
jgi:NAD-dependent SIR2 family protein deacetylase